MTEHPMTDGICDELSIKRLSKLDYDYESITFAEGIKSDMRTAADWQLEQVIEWLKDHLDERYIDDGDVLAPGIDAESVVDDFRAAMRPQEDN